MSNILSPKQTEALPLKRPRAVKAWQRVLAGWVKPIAVFLGHQASLEKLNRLLLSAVTVGFLVTIATYGWVVHQKFTLQQLIQETQSLQESNTAHSIQLNRLQSFTGIMKNAQASHWLSEPKETLTLLTPMGQPLPSSVPLSVGQHADSTELPPHLQATTVSQRWPLVTGY